MTSTATNQRPDVGYTGEGDGIVARCTGCGWETWRQDRPAAQTAAADHKKCRAEDVAFLKRQRASQGGRR